MVNFDERLWRVYERGRRLSEETLNVWMETIASYVPRGRTLRALDLGSGNGRFCPALAEWFGGSVYGIEPAAHMRSLARLEHSHERVLYVGGCAEAIPLVTHSSDLALLFLSFHHFSDRRLAAAELARVVASNGVVVIRTEFGDRLRESLWHRYFPSAGGIEARMYPTLEETTQVFAHVGMRTRSVNEVRYQAAANFADYTERVGLRPFSPFQFISEDEFKVGMADMTSDADAYGDAPIYEVGTLLVLEKVDE